MIETKSKTKLVKLLGSIVLGLAFLCLGFFAGFGGKIEEFVKGAGEPTTGGTTSSYENAMIYVDSGATTNITGGSVGAMESGNSVYVADGGTLNVTGGTVSGNIYNGGTLNYTAGTLNSVTLASGKYITFKGNPSSTISITLYGGASVGETVGYLDGISSVTLSRLSVTNLPSNTKLRISGNYITIAYVDRTVSFEVDPSGYGTVSQSTLSVPHGSSVSVSGSTLSYGGTTVTATPAAQTAQYTYSFAGWYVGDTQITSSRTITANTTITARFTRTTRTYTVTITRNYTSYGTVSRSSVTNVPYGTVLSTSSNTLNINGTTVTATPATASAQYSYSFSSWTNGTATVTGNLTVTANFTRSTRTYTVIITENDISYGYVSTSIVSVPYGTVLSTSGNTLNVNGTRVIATPAARTAQYSYSFSSWTNGTATVTEHLIVTANFTRTLRTYTVTIHEYNASYGSVSPTVIEDVPYGTEIYRGSSITQLYVGETLVTATPNSSTAQYSYSVSSWREDSSSGTTITTTGFTLEGDKDIYVRFTKNTRSYWVYAYARYSTSSSGTNSGATAGITGGTATITYGSTNTTTTGSSHVRDYVTYYGSVTLTAEAATGYVFVGWYSSTVSTTAVSTSSSYSLTITETAFRFAFFKRASYTITIAVSPSGYGSVSQTSVTADYGTSISASGNTLSIGDTDITATPASQTAQYTYSFSSWSNASGTVTGARTITANFTKTTRTYTVRIIINDTSCGTVSTSSVTNVPYGTVLSESSNTLNVNGTTVTATPASQTAQYTYAFSNWANGTATVTGNLTVTAIFSRSERLYHIYVYARYSTSSSGTNSGATAGITGGTASITYYSSTGTTSGTGAVTRYVPYNGSVTLTAEAATGYVFVGWYSSTGSNSAVSTSSSYSLTVTGTTYRYAFFRRASYTITIAVSPSGYGSVSQTSVTADYGTSISTSGSTLSIGDTDITATPARQTAQYTYSFSSWSNASGTVTGARTITANFSRSTRTYTVTVIPRYSTSTSGTNATATNGTTGGTVSTTSTSATNGYSMIIPGIRYNSSVSITASPASGYSFVGWYTSTSSTSATSTSSTYRPTVTGSRTYYAFFRKAGYTVTFTKTVSAPSTFAPSSLLVQEDPGISVYYIVMRALQFGPRATWGGDGLTSNQSSYTVSGSQDFYVNYTIPKTTTVEGTGTTIGYTQYHSVEIIKNTTTVLDKTSTTTLQTGTYDFTTTGTTTIKIELKTWQSGAVIAFDDNLSNENKDNPIYIDKRQYVILQKRILY